MRVGLLYAYIIIYCHTRSTHRGDRPHKHCTSTICHLDSTSESSLPALVVPLLDPRIRAQIAVHVLKVLAHLVALAFHLLAAVKVQIALIAVLSLVRIREARIEGSRLQGQCACRCCWGHFVQRF